ncbi:hypothetical protein RRG08_008685 [Elysia crispata]|uniref:Uncharacterized protein n=1 Tax=Elysia crispata TaxID=231223 RepID=A0AAE0YKY4_9GAST|nr:hypothetical protein RRG08_008685 [Elysia crispata]
MKDISLDLSVLLKPNFFTPTSTAFPAEPSLQKSALHFIMALPEQQQSLLKRIRQALLLSFCGVLKRQLGDFLAGGKLSVIPEHLSH